MAAEDPILNAWAAALGRGDGVLPESEGLADALESHGIAAACAQRLHGSEPWRALAPALTARLRGAARSLAARELAWAPQLERVAGTFAQARLPWLVIKGEALARTHYPKPGMRERCDVDAWVRREDFERAGTLLESLGFAVQASATGYWSLPERCFSGPAGLAIDLHESLFSQPLLAGVLDFATAFERSRELPGLAARAPCDADALLIAVLHRLAHHAGERGRLIWLHDIHLLASAADEAAALARERGVAGLLAEALAAAREAFGTAIDPSLLDSLVRAGAAEPATRLLAPMSRLQRRWFDLRTMPGMRARLAMLRELALPDPRYMRERFAARRWQLPWAYVRRGLSGLARLIRS